jgi:hypothetical protein
MTTKNVADKIAARTHDAYSRPRFSDAGWLGVVQALLDQGATAAEAEWVLNSKHMRWAADSASRNYGATLKDFLAYANSPHVGSVLKLVLAARYELKPKPATLDGATLAGACEGEQIAQMIDLLRQAARGGNIQNSATILIAEIERRHEEGR